MKAKYTFAVLRYVHDIQTEEFANIGIVLYVPSLHFLEARCSFRYKRLSDFFVNVDGGHYRFTIRQFEDGVRALSARLFQPIPYTQLPADARACANEVLPADESALQVSTTSGGLTDKPERLLEHLYHRYVDRYYETESKRSRSDDDILPILKESLGRKKLLGEIRPKVIRTPNYEHEFPVAWKNGVWNTCDAVSFDLLNASDILEKANRWLGRAHTLQESSEQFRLVLFLGKPNQTSLYETYEKAVHILEKLPGKHKLVSEEESGELADEIAKDVRHQGA